MYHTLYMSQVHVSVVMQCTVATLVLTDQLEIFCFTLYWFVKEAKYNISFITFENMAVFLQLGKYSSVNYKILKYTFGRVILNRVKDFVEERVRKKQAEFRRNQSYVYQINTVRSFIE